MGTLVPILENVGDPGRPGGPVQLVAVGAHERVVLLDHEHRRFTTGGQVLDQGGKTYSPGGRRPPPVRPARPRPRPPGDPHQQPKTGLDAWDTSMTTIVTTLALRPLKGGPSSLASVSVDRGGCLSNRSGEVDGVAARVRPKTGLLPSSGPSAATEP